jgi:hypothetical protein
MGILRCLRSADLWLLAALRSFGFALNLADKSQQQLGDHWPLTVESGHLDCDLTFNG